MFADRRFHAFNTLKKDIFVSPSLYKRKMVSAIEKIIGMQFQLDYDGCIGNQKNRGSDFMDFVPDMFRSNFLVMPEVVKKEETMIVRFKVKLPSFNDLIFFIQKVLVPDISSHNEKTFPKAAVRITYRDYVIYETIDQTCLPFHPHRLPFVLAVLNANYTDSRIDEHQYAHDFVLLPRAQSGHFI